MEHNIRIDNFPLRDETNKIISAGVEIHKILGHGFLEIVYKDAFEYEFKHRYYKYAREKMYDIPYKEIVLPHKFYADFVLFDQVILEIKAKEGIAEED